MKHCNACQRDFSDLVETCTECGKVLVLRKKRSRSGRKESGGDYSSVLPRRETGARVIFTGNRSDVDFVKSILDAHDIPSLTGRSVGDAELYDLSVARLQADKAEELLEDVYPAPYGWTIRETGRFSEGERPEYLGLGREEAGNPGQSLFSFARDGYGRRIFNFVFYGICLTAILVGLYFLARNLYF